MNDFLSFRLKTWLNSKFIVFTDRRRCQLAYVELDSFQSLRTVCLEEYFNLIADVQLARRMRADEHFRVITDKEALQACNFVVLNHLSSLHLASATFVQRADILASFPQNDLALRLHRWYFSFIPDDAREQNDNG